MYEFQHPTPVAIALRVYSGVVTLHAEDRDTVEVTVEAMDGKDSSREAADKTRVVLEGDGLHIEVPGNDSFIWRRSSKLAITARVPRGSSVSGKSASADVQAGGSWSGFTIDVASADVEIAEVTGDASLNAASGDLSVGRVGGSLRIETTSGDLRVGDVTGDVSAKVASGDISIASIGGRLKASAASGDIEIRRLNQGRSEISSASGDVQVGIAPGAGIWLDLNTAAGRTTSDLTPQHDAPPATDGPTIELRVRTASGDIHIHRATEGKAA